MSGHTDSVYAAAFSPDGTLLATASADATIRVWDARSGRSLATLRNHRGMVAVLAWTPDGALLLSAGQDGARLWDPNGWREVVHLAGDPAGVRVAAIDPGGRFAAVGGLGGQVDVIDLAGREAVRSLQLGASATALDFDRRGRLVTASWSGVAQVWQVPDGQLLFSLVGHGDKMDHAEFSPDGRWIVTAGRDGTARVWDANSGAMVAVLRGHRGPVFRAHFDAASERIVTAGDDAAAVWDRASHRRTALYEGHAVAVSDARFSSDGSRVATYSWDGTAVVWSVADAYLAVRGSRPGGACSFPAGSPRESRHLVVPCGERTSIWDAEGNAPIAELPGAELAAASDDGQRAITASGSAAIVWDLGERRELGRIPHRGAINAVDWSPVGRRALSAGEDGALHLWSEGEPTRTIGEPGKPITAAAFTPDGRVLAGDGEGTLRLFDAASGAELASLSAGGGIDGLRFSRDGRRLVVIPSIGVAQPSLWDVERRARIGELTGTVGALIDARFDRTGESLVTASGDGVVRLYSGTTGAPLGELTGSPQFTASAAFDPSGHLVAATGGDGAIRFWDPASLQLLWVLDAFPVAGVELRFTGDERVLTRDWDGVVHVWQLDRHAMRVDQLDELLRCRSAVRFDHTRRTPVGAPRPASCL